MKGRHCTKTVKGVSGRLSLVTPPRGGGEGAAAPKSAPSSEEVRAEFSARKGTPAGSHSRIRPVPTWLLGLRPPPRKEKRSLPERSRPLIGIDGWGLGHPRRESGLRPPRLENRIESHESWGGRGGGSRPQSDPRSGLLSGPGGGGGGLGWRERGGYPTASLGRGGCLQSPASTHGLL